MKNVTLEKARSGRRTEQGVQVGNVAHDFFIFLMHFYSRQPAEFAEENIAKIKEIFECIRKTLP